MLNREKVYVRIRDLLKDRAQDIGSAITHSKHYFRRKNSYVHAENALQQAFITSKAWGFPLYMKWES
jgi:hypothetical protein